MASEPENGEDDTLNTEPDTQPSSVETPPSAPVLSPPAGGQDAAAPTLIRDLTDLPDFPACTVGLNVDIGGFHGVVLEIVNRSMRVKAPEGNIQSFNTQVLKKLYGRHVRNEEPPTNSTSKAADPVAKVPESRTRRAATPEPDDTIEPESKPARVVIEEPDFELPVRGIREIVVEPDYPKSSFGQHIEIEQFQGVVVEIVKNSLKVRSSDGELRSYNGIVLKKLYGPGDAN